MKANPSYFVFVCVFICLCYVFAEEGVKGLNEVGVEEENGVVF